MARRPSVLERAGLGFFRRRDHQLDAVVPEDDIHYLNEGELQRLRRIQWAAMARAAVAGSISAAVVAAGELYGLPSLGLSAEGGAGGGIGFYGGLLALSAAAAVVEIGYLYFDALRAVHDLARAAGLELFDDTEGDDAVVAQALARAALELPDPRDPVFGVDPNREVSGWRLVAASVLYKAKIALTSFLMKALLRRALGRALVRSWLPFVSVPITALWNVAICFKVLREARLRVMGPSAIHASLDEILAGPIDPEAAIRAVAATIVKKRRLHPNHRVLLTELCRRLGKPSAPDVDDPERFFAAVEGLSPEHVQPVLQVLALALTLDGRLSTHDRRLADAAAERAGWPDYPQQVRDLRHTFVHGQGVVAALPRRTAGGDSILLKPVPEAT